MTDTLFASWTTYGIALGVFILAYTIYSMFGFGSGLICVGMLALFVPVQDVVVLVLMINIPVELWVIYRTASQIPWRRVLPILVGVVVCVPLGAHVLSVGRPETILVALGVVLVVAGVAFLVFERAAAIRPRLWGEPLVGAASGLLGGAFGTGGPPLLLYFQLARFDKVAFRGALIAIFHAISIVRVISYTFEGLFTVERFVAGATLLPAMALGVILGSRLHVGVDEGMFRRLVSVSLVVIGVMLVVTRG